MTNIETIIKKINNRFLEGDDRFINVKKNIFGSFILKILSIVFSLLIVSTTIKYVNPVQYGIWLTLSSIITWISYFDFGFAHGFRNRFAEAKANNDYILAKKYVSTTYFLLTILFTFIFIIIIILNNFVSWSSILNINPIFKSELRDVFNILAFFTCLNTIANVFTTLLLADQRPATSSFIQMLGQFLSLIVIFILTKFTTGSLFYLALLFSGIPCLLLIVVTIIMFRGKRYKMYSPSLKFIELNLTKKILGLGGKFFVIMISMLVIFQLMNIIISRLLGPDAVTQYNIAYKYFSIINMVIIIILTPFWSAFTDAYVKEDYNWMLQMVNKLEKIFLLCLPLCIIMLIFSNWAIKLWIGNSVKISFYTLLSVALYILACTWGAVYMYLINGIGKVKLQLIIYLLFSLISYPLMYFTCKMYGLVGIVIMPTIVYITQAIFGRIQVYKIINKNAKGIWNK